MEIQNKMQGKFNINIIKIISKMKKKVNLVSKKVFPVTESKCDSETCASCSTLMCFQ